MVIIRGKPPLEMLRGYGCGNYGDGGYGDGGDGYGGGGYGYGDGGGYGESYGGGGYGGGGGDGGGYGESYGGYGGGGDGYGYGDGYGSGFGSGYGYGDGYGDGDGDGYGYGSGSGYGYGDADGGGYGDGDGGYGGGGVGGDDPELIHYWTKTIDGIVPQSKQVEMSKSGAILAYWRSTKDGEPANGGRGTKAVPGLVETTGGKLEICRNGFHATLSPPRWKGERVWVVALYPPFQFHGDKIASLKREFVCEAQFSL